MSSNTFFLKSNLLRQARGLFICTSLILSFFGLNAQTVADTFDTADIPTNLGSYSPSCNGPLTKLSISLPPGGSWNVTSITIAYNMTAQSGGFKSHQRSYVRCQNTFMSEDSIYQGTGNSGGIQAYNRSGVDIANGNYAGGAILNFEMRAWRTAIGTGCSTANNKIDNFTWIITVHYNQIADEGSVGIGTTSPATSAILDLSSTTQAFLPPRLTTMQRDAIANPVNGMVIFNTTKQKLEIYINSWGAINLQQESIRKLVGGSLNEEIPFLLSTPDGGFIVVGYSQSSNTGNLSGFMNNGAVDGWIVKFNSSGTIVWQKLLGGSQVDHIRSVDLTPDGGYILIGHSLSSNTGTLVGLNNNGVEDVWIIKLNANGNTVWQKLIGGSALDKGYDIKALPGGGYIGIANSNSSNTGSLTGLTTNGLGDSWVFKLDASGNFVWQKLLGGTNQDIPWEIAITDDGGYVIANETLSSNTGSLTGLINFGGYDAWIFKLDVNGNFVWNKNYGGTSDDNSRFIIKTSDGGLLAVGFTYTSNSGTLTGVVNNGSADYWIHKLDDTGLTLWQRLYGGTGFDEPLQITETTEGSYGVSGASSSTNTGSLAGITNNGAVDNLIMKVSNSGALNWIKLIGGAQNDFAHGIDKSPDGGFYISSSSSSANTGNLGGLIGNGLDDWWIYKIDVNGNLY